MSERVPRPRWFTIVHRVLACTIVLTLAGLLAMERTGFHPPSLIFELWAWLTLGTPFAFVFLQWIGCGEGYVPTLDAALYSALLGMAICAGCGGALG